jgi:tRNA A37 methylthiotransferase MiaB
MNKKLLYVTKITPNCYTSSLDCDDFTRLFLENDYVLTTEVGKADSIVLSTCTVVSKQEEKSIEVINDLIKTKKSDAEIFIVGCSNGNDLERIIKNHSLTSYKSDQLDDLKKYLKLKKNIAEGGLRDLQPGIFHHRLKLFKTIFTFLDSSRKILLKITPYGGYMLDRYVNTAYAFSPETYYLRIGSGCTNNCSYCIIKKNRGRHYSLGIDNLLSEINLALKQGYTHFLLVSDDFTSYGLDIGMDYTELLKKIFSLSDDFSITIYNFNPMDCKEKFDKFLETISIKRIKCIHYVCQSGSDKILKAMNRRYTKKQYVETALAVLKKDPAISLRTDFIVGFPGETEKDFKESISIVEKIPFETVNIFKYSDRPGICSEKLGGKISEETKSKRIRILKNTFYRKQLSRWIRSMLHHEMI